MSKLKVLLLGGSGQLGKEILKLAPQYPIELRAPFEDVLDITNPSAVQSAVTEFAPDCVINVAAYTAVDKAEEDSARAYLINRDAALTVAKAAKVSNARFIQVSTDYVFDGCGSTPLRETDATNPLGVYGASKCEAEKAILQNYPGKSLIVRTSSLHGQYGMNFVHTMLKLFDEREVIQVVSDQIMSPTWAGWLAQVLFELCPKNDTGILHVSCDGVVSWHEFASAIKELTDGQRKTNIDTKIEEVSIDSYKRPAPRPKYSAFDLSKLEAVLGRKPMPWIEGLKSHLCDIGYKVS